MLLGQLAENRWLDSEVQRALVFELDFATEKVMLNVRDRQLYEDYLQLEGQPAGVRRRIIDQLGRRFEPG